MTQSKRVLLQYRNQRTLEYYRSLNHNQINKKNDRTKHKNTWKKMARDPRGHKYKCLGKTVTLGRNGRWNYCGRAAARRDQTRSPALASWSVSPSPDARFMLKLLSVRPPALLKLKLFMPSASTGAALWLSSSRPTRARHSSVMRSSLDLNAAIASVRIAW
jgi:hypothetical protein